MEDFLLNLAGSWAWLAALCSSLVMFLQAFALPLPAISLTVMNVYLFGLAKGVALSWGSAVLGSIGAYMLAQRLGRPFLCRHFSAKTIRRIDKLALDGQKGFWLVFFARALPFVPFGLASYAAGLAQMPFRPYFLGTAFGKIVPTLFYAGVGQALVQWAPDAIPFILLAIVLIALLVFAIHVFWKKEESYEKEEARESI